MNALCEFGRDEENLLSKRQRKKRTQEFIDSQWDIFENLIISNNYDVRKAWQYYLVLSHDIMRENINSLITDLEFTRTQVQYLQEKLDHTEIIEVEISPGGYLIEAK